MPCFENPIDDGQPLCGCIIASAGNPKQWGFYTALVDTGAVQSAVSGKVARDLSIPCHRMARIIGVHGTQTVKAYKIHMALCPLAGKNTGENQQTINSEDMESSDLLKQEVVAAEFNMPGQKYDVIVGMDYLDLCTLVVSKRKFIIWY